MAPVREWESWIHLSSVCVCRCVCVCVRARVWRLIVFQYNIDMYCLYLSLFHTLIRMCLRSNKNPRCYLLSQSKLHPGGSGRHGFRRWVCFQRLGFDWSGGCAECERIRKCGRCKLCCFYFELRLNWSSDPSSLSPSSVSETCYPAAPTSYFIIHISF